MTTPSDNGSETEEVWTIIGPDGATEFRGDIFAEMARQEEIANSKVTDAQRMIGTEGHHWWCRTDHSFLICGHVPLMSETLAKEREYYAEDADSEELAEYQDIEGNMRERWARGYRFGRAYSEVCPEGELGDTHIVEMVEITQAHFDVAQRCGWDMSRIMQLVEEGDVDAISFVTLLIRRAVQR